MSEHREVSHSDSGDAREQFVASRSALQAEPSGTEHEQQGPSEAANFGRKVGAEQHQQLVISGGVDVIPVADRVAESPEDTGSEATNLGLDESKVKHEQPGGRGVAHHGDRVEVSPEEGNSSEASSRGLDEGEEQREQPSGGCGADFRPNPHRVEGSPDTVSWADVAADESSKSSASDSSSSSPEKQVEEDLIKAAEAMEGPGPRLIVGGSKRQRWKARKKDKFEQAKEQMRQNEEKARQTVEMLKQLTLVESHVASTQDPSAIAALEDFKQELRRAGALK